MLSIEAALGATVVALVLGLAGRARRAPVPVLRARDASRSLLVLPLALPGIVTGIALNATDQQRSGVAVQPRSTIIIGHATFCVVVVYNNVIARLRRSSALDRGGVDGPGRRHAGRRSGYVTLPVIATALLAGGLLAFALSFDEIIVTKFTAGTEQTLPIWIFANLRLPNQRPIVNVVAVVADPAVRRSPSTSSQRLSSDAGAPGRRA